MTLYRYKAMNRNGRIRTGNLESANEYDLEQRLQRLELDLVRAIPIKARTALFGSKRIERIDLINFCFSMEQMTRAGVPLLQGLGDLRDSVENPKFRDVIVSVYDEIEAGASLSDALNNHTDVFDNLFVSLIRSGEASGQLPDVLESLSDTLKWQDDLGRSMKKIIMAPIIVMVVVLGVTSFLMIYLVPQLVSFLMTMGEELPLQTRALIATSDFFINYWYLMIAFPAIVIPSIKLSIKKSLKFKFEFDRIVLGTPKIGLIIQKIILSRFANFFAMMYKAGIPILESLRISEGIIDNEVIKRALSDAREDIEQGSPISKSFEQTGLFPPLVIRMLQIGEQTGQLDKALINVSYFYDRDVRDAIDKLQELISPVLTAIVGLILGWVMMSVLGPIYSTISSIQI
jgi:type IV pilus assembly protein PilC